MIESVARRRHGDPRAVTATRRCSPVLSRRRGARARRARPADRAPLRLGRRTPSGLRRRRHGRGCSSRARSPRPAETPPRPIAHDGELLVRGLGAAPGRRQRPRPRRHASSPTPESSATGDILVTHMTAPDWVPLMRALGGDRHRLGRDDLPRGDRLARARHPLRGRHRRGDHEAARRRAGHRRRRPAASSARARSQTGRKARRPPLRPTTAAAPVTGDQAARQPLRALAGRARGGARRRRRRPAARRADGARGARGRAPAAADRGRAGASEFVDRMGEALTTFAAGLRAAADHLPDDRLPHQRVPRPRGRRSLRARGGEPDDRLPRRACATCSSPTSSRLELDAIRRVWDAGPHELPRHAPVRPHRARARGVPAAIAGSGPARRARVRAVGDGRGALGALQPRALRRARRRRHLDRLQRPHPAAARRRPRLGGRRRGLRRARPGGRPTTCGS